MSASTCACPEDGIEPSAALLSLRSLLHTLGSSEPLPAVPAPAERRRLRVSAGVTQEVAALVIGITASSLSKWEAGLRPARFLSERYRAVLGALLAMGESGAPAAAESPLLASGVA